ncbi:MAG: hypothetical protein JO092_08570, partial [Candidatus Eremiobacteraeota bacterium]|nr:hypothetical protein [Candidatus Eremiobacteraeota bacterium]
MSAQTGLRHANVQRQKGNPARLRAPRYCRLASDAGPPVVVRLNRSAFLVSLAGAALPARVRAQSDADPAVTSASPALRVLLGSGDAEPGPAPGAFLFNGQAYRGAFVRLRDGTIVNVVDIEQYLYSVVAREMPARWPATALEAQAICARTYVLQRSNP